MKYDIVYFVKNTTDNEELRYSLRSVVKNFPYNRIWFVGGCPIGLKPDKMFTFVQIGDNKYEKVRTMIKAVCKEDEISDDFWLFNDDFFVMREVENIEPFYHNHLEDYVARIEHNFGDKPTAYTSNLRATVEELKSRGLETLNYEEHMPMLINKAKMLEVIAQFPFHKGTRSLYGNYHKIGGINTPDVKIFSLDHKPKEPTSAFLSTTNESFANGKVGEFIRSKFADKCKYEE